jgi:ribosome-associated protein
MVVAGRKKSTTETAETTVEATAETTTEAPKRSRVRKTSVISEKKTSTSRKKTSTAAAAPQEASSLNLAMQIVAAAQDKKAEDIVVLQLKGVTSYTDYLVICSGTSDRQVVAIADGVELSLKKQGVRTFSSEGHAEGQWVLLDYGDVVLHVFYHHLRDFYDLEGLWSEAQRIPVPEPVAIPSTRP